MSSKLATEGLLRLVCCVFTFILSYYYYYDYDYYDYYYYYYYDDYYYYYASTPGSSDVASRGPRCSYLSLGTPTHTHG